MASKKGEPQTKQPERIIVTLTRGLVGTKETQRRVVKALGLGKFGSSAIHHASPTILGMCKKIEHLVTVAPAES